MVRIPIPEPRTPHGRNLASNGRRQPRTPQRSEIRYRATHACEAQRSRVLDWRRSLTGSAVDRAELRARRNVVSFVRRSNRMRPNQRRAGRRTGPLRPRGPPPEHLDLSPPAASLDLVEAFAVARHSSWRSARRRRVARSDGGGSPASQRAGVRGLPARYRRMLAQLAKTGIDNVDCRGGRRGRDGDLLPTRSVDEIWLFFPDPWHKSRHHKRRLLTAEFAALCASRMRPAGSGGLRPTGRAMPTGSARFWTAIHPSPMCILTAGRRGGPEADHPLRAAGLDAGRQIFDLAYRRVG